MASLAALSLLFCMCILAHSAPIELNEGNFESELKKGSIFVKFYAPWCGHCKSLIPTWDTLSDDLSSSSVRVGKFDCTVDSHRKYCEVFDVKGFPTLHLIKDGKSALFEGKRTLEELKSFALKTVPSNSLVFGPKITKQTIKWSENNDVATLTSANFSLAQEGTWLVEFYADWCGFCQNLIPEYEKVATALKGKVNVAKVNNDNIQGAILRAFDVTSIPTIKLIRDGKVFNLTYAGQKADKLVEFVEKGWQELESSPFPLVSSQATNHASAKKQAPSLVQSPLAEFLAQPNLNSIENIIKQFSFDEAVMGAILSLLLFGLGFVFGRLTASSPKTVVTPAKKSS